MSVEPTRDEWALPSGPSSVAKARQLLLPELIDLPTDHRELVLLLTSELVTNAVRHGAGPITMHLVSSDRGIQVEVDDAGPGRPHVLPMDVGASSGRGLMVVDRLASSWGVDRHAHGKTVWFRCHHP